MTIEQKDWLDSWDYGVFLFDQTNNLKLVDETREVWNTQAPINMLAIAEGRA